MAEDSAAGTVGLAAGDLVAEISAVAEASTEVATLAEGVSVAAVVAFKEAAVSMAGTAAAVNLPAVGSDPAEWELETFTPTVAISAAAVCALTAGTSAEVRELR